MNLDELQSVQSRERQATSLQNLRSSFYQDAGEFIQELTRERDRAAERADDPFSSPEVRRLSDDIQTAKQTVEAIYERRVGKVVKMASIAAADMPTDDEGLTDEEAVLFDTLVDQIKKNRTHVLDEVLEGEGSAISCARDPSSTQQQPDASPATPETPSTAETNTETNAAAELGLNPTPDSMTADETDAVDAASMMGDGADDPSFDPPAKTDAGGRESTRTEVAPDPAPPNVESEPTPPENDADTDVSESTSPSVDRTTVRITRDVGEIFGVDERTYELSSDEVVTLPAANAEPLVQREAAEKLE